MRDGCDSGSGRAALRCVKLIDCGDAGRPGYMREQELAWAIGGCCARAPCQASGASFAWRCLCPLSSGAVVALSTCHLRFAHAAKFYREGCLSVMRLRFSRGVLRAARGGCKQIAASSNQSRPGVRLGGMATSGFSGRGRGGETIVVAAYSTVGMHGLGVGVAGVDGREMELGGDGVGGGSRGSGLCRGRWISRWD
jgi:hypothetical protein